MYHMALRETHLSHIHLNKTRISASILLKCDSDKEYYIQQYGYNTFYSVKNRESFQAYLKGWWTQGFLKEMWNDVFSTFIKKKEYKKEKWEKDLFPEQ